MNPSGVHGERRDGQSEGMVFKAREACLFHIWKDHPFFVVDRNGAKAGWCDSLGWGGSEILTDALSFLVNYEARSSPENIGENGRG